MNEVQRTLWELVLVTAVGLVVGLTANAMSKTGLVLTRNYFQKPHRSEGPGSQAAPGAGPATVEPGRHPASLPVNDRDVPEKHVQAVIDAGLQVIEHQDVVALFRDPAYVAGEVVFVDARNDELYAKGHIPSAYQLDHYQLDRYIDTVLPVCQAAVKVIVYCQGDDCEDSMFAAGDLQERGVDPQRLFVYVGGIKAWKRHKLELETGARLSGQITRDYADE